MRARSSIPQIRIGDSVYVRSEGQRSWLEERSCWVEVQVFALYPRCVPPSPTPHRSPTPGLFLGLIITLTAVVACSGYITWQISGLRELQKNLVDRNRRDSLQLLRIQN